jgi:lysophospholipase L1-like esterase
MKRFLSVALSLAALASLGLAQSAKPKIMLVGDSTQTTQAGYGLGFCANLVDVDCLNYAHGGTSTKTYRRDGFWSKALAAKPDYMLIQFGHNDVQSSSHQDRETDLATEYPANLRQYVAEARAAGIKPILVTPIARRYYKEDGKVHDDLEAHAAAMRKLAAELKTPLIDLHADSLAYLNSISEAESELLANKKRDADGKLTGDRTHFNQQGAYVFGRIVAVDLGKAVPALTAHVKPAAALLPPEAIHSVAILNGARLRIVLVGDSTVNVGGGWGPGFCALAEPNVDCVNMARNGRSSKSYLDEGVWTEALAQHGDYVFLQFGHNDQPGKGAKRETDPETTYAANMRRYITEARAAGAHPIVVTSLSRRNYKDGKLVEDLTAYAKAAKRVAEEENVPCIDLNASSTRFLRALTQAQADRFDANTHPDATGKGPDRTHINPEGSTLFGSMVINDLVRLVPELLPSFKPTAPEPASASVVPVAVAPPSDPNAPTEKPDSGAAAPASSR